MAKVKHRVKQVMDRRSRAPEMALKVWRLRQSSFKHLSMGAIVRYSLYPAPPRLQSLPKHGNEALLQDYNQDGFLADLLRYVDMLEQPKDRTYALLEGVQYAVGNLPCFVMSALANPNPAASHIKNERHAFWVQTCDMLGKQLRLINGDSQDARGDEEAAKDRGSSNDDGHLHSLVWLALSGLTSDPTSTGWTQTFSKWLEQHCEKGITDTRTSAYLQAFGSYLRRFASEELTVYSQRQDQGLLKNLFELIDDTRPRETVNKEVWFHHFFHLTQWHLIREVLGPFLERAIESSQLRKRESSRLRELESSRPEDVTRTVMYRVPLGLEADWRLYVAVGGMYADVLQTLSEKPECFQDVSTPSLLGGYVDRGAPMVVHTRSGGNDCIVEMRLGDEEGNNLFSLLYPPNLPISTSV